MPKIKSESLNKFDNPDFVYGRHDGTVLKRLFAAFSFRPTVVTTMPIGQIFSYNPYFQNLRPLVTSIPMINVRLLKTAGGAVDLQQIVANGQTQQFIEGNVLVQRATNVMYSREVVAFFVDRRSQTYTLNSTPFNVLRMPSSVAGFETVSDAPVTVPGVVTLQDGTEFLLRSAVCVDTKQGLDPNNANANHVVGSMALIDSSVGTVREWYLYKPTQVTRGRAVFEQMAANDVQDYLTKYGVIYIYQNTRYNDAAQVLTFN